MHDIMMLSIVRTADQGWKPTLEPMKLKQTLELLFVSFLENQFQEHNLKYSQRHKILDSKMQYLLNHIIKRSTKTAVTLLSVKSVPASATEIMRHRLTLVFTLYRLIFMAQHCINIAPCHCGYRICIYTTYF